MSKELQKQTVDRVLAALSPALTAELDRVTNETRRILEAEFEKRMAKAVQDAQAAVWEAAGNKTQLAIEETRESVSRQVTGQLQEEFARTLAESKESSRRQVMDEQREEFDRVLAETKESVRRQVSDEQREEFAKVLAESNSNLRAKFDGEFSKAQLEWSSERDRMEQQQIEQWHVVAEAQKQLTDAPSQSEILVRWMKLAEPFSASVAIYTAKAGGLALWKSHGGAVFPEFISPETTIPESYFKLIVVRDKTVAAVCAVEPYRPEALDFLVATMERAIELFGWKLRVPTAKPGGPETARLP